NELPHDYLAAMKQESGPLGSNPGGIFRHPDGSEWYIKTPKTIEGVSQLDRVKNEKLAAELYQLAGVPVPEIKLTQLNNGKPAIASRMIDGVTLNQTWNDHLNWGHPYKGLQDSFAADAWLANWDSVGLGKDNVLISPDGLATRIDLGGSLRYRAQGMPK